VSTVHIDKTATQIASVRNYRSTAIQARGQLTARGSPPRLGAGLDLTLAHSCLRPAGASRDHDTHRLHAMTPGLAGQTIDQGRRPP
jgi:hypothetical protein